MAVIRSEYPILEYDDNPNAVIMPDHEGFDVRLPECAVFPFLYDRVDSYAAAHGCRQVAEFTSATKQYPVYVTEHRGIPVCLCQAPVGSAAATQLMDWLIAYGAKRIVSAGSCGVLEDLTENAFLVPVRALRDEGTSYHYAPPSRFIDMDLRAVRAVERALEHRAIAFDEVTTWTTDGFYRETRDMVALRKSEGCAVVEMECAALAACAKLRGVIWGELLFTADTLANLEHYDERNWGGDSWDRALELCLDAAIELLEE